MRGSSLPSRISCEEFRVWSDSCNFTHLITRGAELTWYNSKKSRAHTEKRLDRIICNDDWLDFWISSSCCTLTRNQPDHFPMQLDCRKGPQSTLSHFKFHGMWTEHSNDDL